MGSLSAGKGVQVRGTPNIALMPDIRDIKSPSLPSWTYLELRYRDRSRRRGCLSLSGGCGSGEDTAPEQGREDPLPRRRCGSADECLHFRILFTDLQRSVRIFSDKNDRRGTPTRALQSVQSDRSALIRNRNISTLRFTNDAREFMPTNARNPNPPRARGAATPRPRTPHAETPCPPRPL